MNLIEKNKILLSKGNFGETPGLCESDFKEYENLNGFYLKISYLDDTFSIIAYNMELLDGNKYETKISIDKLLIKNDIFQKLGYIKNIFDFICDLISKEKYKFVADEKLIKFYLYLKERNDEDKNNRIGFILKLDKNKDKSEYIDFLKNIIRKSKNNFENNSIKDRVRVKINKNGEKLKVTFDNKIDNYEVVENESKLFSFNCNKCPLIPEIHIEMKKNLPLIESICQNKHINKKMDLISYLESGKNFSKNSIKCNCSKNENNSEDLFYCHDCQIIYCNRCSSEDHIEHKNISEDLMHCYCIEHKIQYSSFCNSCYKNICVECSDEHKNHKIYAYDEIILLEDDFNKKYEKSEKIISYLNKVKDILDSYKNEFIEKINKLKNLYQTEIDLLNIFINRYKKCLHNYVFNYQIIQNLDFIDSFQINGENIINEEDSFSEKTSKLLKIFDETTKTKNIKLIKKFESKETIYSLSFLKGKNLIVMGLEKKIDLYDDKLNFITSFSNLDGKIAYIKELWDDKILVIDLNPRIKILEIKDNQITLFKSIITKDERNFVGTGLSNNNIICGGDRYLSIIGKKILLGYSMIQSLDLDGFISNIVEIDSESYLVGQSHNKRLLIISSNNNEILDEINNIRLRSNNYSIDKISDKFIGIVGYDKSETKKACIFLLSIKSKKICTKFYYNELETFMVICKLNDNEIITTGNGSNVDQHSDIIILKINDKEEEVNIKKECLFKRAYCDTIEAIISFENYILASDSSSNLKLLEIK